MHRVIKMDKKGQLKWKALSVTTNFKCEIITVMFLLYVAYQ